MTRFKEPFGKGLYRSRQGMILGVCKGIAGYFDFSVFWTRVIAVGLLLISGFWPAMGLYFVGALIMKPEPVLTIDTEDEQEFYDSYAHSGRSAALRIRRRYEDLERRLQRLEHTVTSPEFDWERRFKD